MTEAPAQFDAWIGRQERHEQVIEPARARQLAVTLDHADPPEAGAPLPALWHWIYFTPETPQHDIGHDGHPRLGGFLPPIALPRRMWAGGRLRFYQPIVIGDTVIRASEITAITHKTGRQGDLVFVTLVHRLSTGRGLAIREEQDLVYRQPPPPGAAPQTATVEAEPAASDWRCACTPDPVLLFRYSALTFNAHRIHYDLPYARDEEAYPGLVVQGPLTATLLADQVSHRAGRRLRAFAFRGQMPLFAGQPMHLCGRSVSGGEYAVWAETPTGGIAMTATAEVDEHDVG
jgi:3-methylfumaryl-CoA hydratase